MKIVNIYKPNTRVFVVLYKQNKKTFQNLYYNIKAVINFIETRHIYNRKQALKMVEVFKEDKSYKLSEYEKEASFKLLKQLAKAKTYKDSPALEYLFQCREHYRKQIKQGA